MKFLVVCFVVLMSVVLASAQFGRFSGFSGDFGGPSAFAGGFQSAGLQNGLRDPRENRGPVVFPPPPSDGPVESSGVVVGASGFGFVPSNQAQNNFNAFNRRNYYF